MLKIFPFQTVPDTCVFLLWMLKMFPFQTVPDAHGYSLPDARVSLLWMLKMFPILTVPDTRHVYGSLNFFITILPLCTYVRTARSSRKALKCSLFKRTGRAEVHRTKRPNLLQLSCNDASSFCARRTTSIHPRCRHK